MLILVRSDFRRDANRTAFLNMLTRSRVDASDIVEVPAVEAPQANAIAIRLRKLEPKGKSLLVIGSMANESAEATIDVLNGVRMLLSNLSTVPTVVLARKFEWDAYGQVAKAPKDIEFFEMPLLQGRTMVLPQAETYNERQYYAVMAQMLPPNFGASSVGATAHSKDRDSTGVMYLEDVPTSQHKKITDSMLEAAGIKAEESAPGVERGDPTLETPLDDADDRITELPPPPPPPEPKEPAT